MVTFTIVRQTDFASSSHKFSAHIDQQKAAWLKSNFCVSEAAFVAILENRNITFHQKAAFFNLALKKQFRY